MVGKHKISSIGKYDEASITRAQGLEGVRLRPGMYIGTNGIMQILKEIIDNSLDEALAGHNDYVGIYLGDPSGFIWVWDFGRGIPVGPHPSDKKTSTLTIVFTEIHSGGKLKENSNYKYSFGTFGVGASVTNALSSIFEVYTFRNNKWHAQQFSHGKPISGVVNVVNPPTPPGLNIGLTHGTLIRFKPDTTIFTNVEDQIDIQELAGILDTTAYFVPQVTIGAYYKGKLKQFHHPQGINDYYNKLLAETKAEPNDDPFVLQSEQVDIILQWSKYPDEWFYSYANARYTSNGGTHLNGLRNAIKDVITPLAGKRQQDFRSEDLRAGLLGVLNFRMGQPEFDGQTKNRLISKGMDKIVYDAVFPALETFFKKHKALAKSIIERANSVRQIENKYKISKEVAAKMREKGGKIIMPVELLDCNTQDPNKREVYICEGASAGGSCKAARNSEFQAVLKLTGKPPNAIKEKIEKIWANERVQSILKSIGWNDKGRPLKVRRIILLPDADDDGHHICCLLIALFHILAPEVYYYNINGKYESLVYFVDAPLYVAQFKGTHIYGSSLANISAKLPKNFDTKDITRMKGLAEASPEVLSQIAFDPQQRRLVRVDRVKDAELKEFLDLMGEDVTLRKKMIGV